MTALLSFLVAALAFVGFLTNLAPNLPLNLGTTVVDVLYLCVAVLACVPGIDWRQVRRFKIPLVLFAFFAAWCAVLTVWSEGPLSQRIMGFRNNVVYPGIWLLLAVSNCRLDIRRIVNCLYFCGLVVCAFAVCQGFWHDRMPDLLLSLTGKEAKFLLNGTAGEIVFRVNGLIGNTIVFSGFAGVAFLLGYVRCRCGIGGCWSWLLLAIPLTAIHLSYTRTANFGLIATWGAAWCLWRIVSMRRLLLKSAIVLFLLGLYASGTLSSSLTEWMRKAPVTNESVFVMRMRGDDKASSDSTKEHIRLLQWGLGQIVEHPVFGLGIGSQGYSSKADMSQDVVRDGYWVAQTLEVGVPGMLAWMGFAAWFVFFLLRMAVSAEDRHLRWVAASLVFGFLYLGMCGLLNSAYWARPNQCVLWLLAGAVASVSRHLPSGAKLAINGFAFVRRRTGIERFAVETVRALDERIVAGRCELVVPSWAEGLPDLRNIRIVRCGFLRSALWEQVCLPFYAIAHGLETVNLCNVVPLLCPGSVCIHDIFYKTQADTFVGVRGRLSKVWHRFQYVWCALLARRIFTVSDYSKREIAREYHVDPRRISVLGNGWEHMLRIEEDEGVFADFPQLVRNSYFLMLGSLSRYKNVEWVLRSAAAHPGAVYVIVGGDMASSPVARERRENLIFTGYLSDGRVKALMANCRALVFPSFAEGFGIPPLEALALGRPVIAAKTSCLPEIYGSAVHWIENPADYSKTDPEELLRSLVTPAADVLSRHSWAKVAATLLTEMGET